MSFDDRGGSKRSNPAGALCETAGATGAADTSVSRATEPKRTVLVREFWRNFDMMISFSRLTRRSRLWHLEENNTVVLHVKVTSQLSFRANWSQFLSQRTGFNMTDRLRMSMMAN